MPVGRAIDKAAGGLAAAVAGGAVVVLIGWGLGLFHRAPPDPPPVEYDQLAEIPQATVADIAALSLTSRTEFMRGYISALAAVDSEWAACTRLWYFVNGGDRQLEHLLTNLDAEPGAAQKRASPMGAYLQANLPYICKKM